MTKSTISKGDLVWLVFSNEIALVLDTFRWEDVVLADMAEATLQMRNDKYCKVFVVATNDVTVLSSGSCRKINAANR